MMQERKTDLPRRCHKHLSDNPHLRYNIGHWYSCLAASVPGSGRKPNTCMTMLKKAATPALAGRFVEFIDRRRRLQCSLDDRLANSGCCPCNRRIASAVHAAAEARFATGQELLPGNRGCGTSGGGAKVIGPVKMQVGCPDEPGVRLGIEHQ
jgi:hypothetical protein